MPHVVPNFFQETQKVKFCLFTIAWKRATSLSKSSKFLISRKKIIQVWNDSAELKEIISGMSPGFGHTIIFKVLFWIPLMPAVFLLQCIQEICFCLE